MAEIDSIEGYLESRGPNLASAVGAWLADQGLTREAARKRLSRARPPVRSFPVPLFPKNTRFLYLEEQRGGEQFWDALHWALRESGSVYGMAFDGVLARAGAMYEKEFTVISGATVHKVKKQVLAKTVLERLIVAGLLRILQSGDERIITIAPAALGQPNIDGIKARGVAEVIILDGLREWARNIGAASYNQIQIRGEPGLQPIQQFSFDLAGPSYLMSLRRGRAQGFLVADVFSNGLLNEFEIRYFIRKAQALHASLAGGTVLPILVADGFTGPALTAGHGAGILMATPETLFGPAVGAGLRSLVETLTRAAAYASSDTPDRLVGLVKSLSVIEGRAGNLRGTLFELMAAYLARRDGVWIDMGVRAIDSKTGAKADIDVLKMVKHNLECVAIECKGREPGGVVSVEEVDTWLRKIGVITAHLRYRFPDAAISCELWSSGDFTPDALARMDAEKARRTRFPIRWKTGKDVLTMARGLREKAMADALEQHFVGHPLVSVIAGDPTPPIVETAR